MRIVARPIDKCQHLSVDPGGSTRWGAGLCLLSGLREVTDIKNTGSLPAPRWQRRRCYYLY